MKEARPNREALGLAGQKIAQLSRDHEQAYREATNDAERTLVLACSIIDLRAVVKEFLPALRQLEGSRLGFLTDRDPGRDRRGLGRYPDPVIVDCAVEALVRGAQWVGNEWNIIAGGCYLTKEFWARKVRQLEGLTDLDVSAGIPKLDGPKCVVGFTATWKLGGVDYYLSRQFSIVVREHQTDDATIGKAEGKMLRAIYKRLTGAEISDAGDDEPDVPVGGVSGVGGVGGARPPAIDAAAPPAAEAPPAEAEMSEWDRANDAQRG